MTPAAPPGNLRGIALMTVAMAIAATTDALIKLTAASVPPPQIMAAIGLGGMVFFGALTLWRGEALLTRDALRPVVLVRSLGELLGTGSIVVALPLVSLSLMTMMLQAVPILVTFGALVVLGERAGWRRWAAIFVGFVGVVLIIRPGSEAASLGVFVAALAPIGQAIRDLASRASPRHLTPLQLSVWGMAFFGVASLALVALSDDPIASPDLPTAAGLAAIVVLAGLIAILVTAAMRSGDVAVVAPFRYTRLVFGIGLGIAIFAERLEPAMLTGVAIVVGSGLYTWHREYRLRRRAPAG